MDNNQKDNINESSEDFFLLGAVRLKNNKYRNKRII